MLQENENPDNGGLEFSPLDRANIEYLEVAEGMESETGEFSVQRRTSNEWKLHTRNLGWFVFHDLEQMFDFLEEKS